MAFKDFSLKKSLDKLLGRTEATPANDEPTVAQVVQALDEKDALNRNLGARRQSILGVFKQAANFSPANPAESETLVVAFDAAVTEVSSNAALFTEGFANFEDKFAFGSQVSNLLKQTAETSKILPLGLRATEGIAATAVLNPDGVRAVYDIGALAAFATEGTESARRKQAVKALAAIVTDKKLRQLEYRGLDIFPQGFVIKDPYNFQQLRWNAQADYQVYAMGVAAHLLQVDPDAGVRQQAAQALRDIAASDRPAFQFLAASWASEAGQFEAAPNVKAVIDGIYEDSRQVNFRKSQKVPGLN